MGDSLTLGTGATSQTYGFPNQTRLIVGSMMTSNSINAGIGGQAVSLMAARFTSDIITPGCQACVLLAGANNISNSVSVATWSGYMVTMLQAAESVAMPMIVGTIPPRHTDGQTSTIRSLTTQYNDWIKLRVPVYGAHVVDFWTAMADGNGDLNTAYIDTAGSNYVHPNDAGYLKMAQTLAPVVLRVAGL